MKNYFLFLLVVLMLGSQGSVFADSYQRWIVWVNEPRHISNASEMADIFAALSQGRILPNKIYQVEQTTFKIAKPDLYFSFLKKCIQVSNLSAVNIAAYMISEIKGSQKVQWGNDLSMKVKNYWINSSGEVVFTPNYSGAELGVWVLLINGIPTIKLDCGNPLEIYPEEQNAVVKIDGSSSSTTYNSQGQTTTTTSQPCGTTIINNYYDAPQQPVEQQRVQQYSQSFICSQPVRRLVPSYGCYEYYSDYSRPVYCKNNCGGGYYKSYSMPVYYGPRTEIYSGSGSPVTNYGSGGNYYQRSSQSSGGGPVTNGGSGRRR